MLVGLLVMGMGMGCTMMPVSGAAVQTLRPHEVARGSTLINVNQQIAGSIGTALMSMILTSQFNRSDDIAIAGKLATVQEEAARTGRPPDPAQIPPQALAPDFMHNVMHDLSQAYTLVFFVAVGLVLLTLLPASFLPKRPVQTAPGQPPTPIMA